MVREVAPRAPPSQCLTFPGMAVGYPTFGIVLGSGMGNWDPKWDIIYLFWLWKIDLFSLEMISKSKRKCMILYEKSL